MKKPFAIFDLRFLIGARAKQCFALLLLLSSCLAPRAWSQTTPVYFNESDFLGNTNLNLPLVIKEVMLVQIGPSYRFLTANTTNLYTTNGLGTNYFLTPALYLANFQGLPQSFELLVPTNTNPVNLAACVPGTQLNFSALPYPIILTNINYDQPGTNVYFTTNGLHRVINLSATASGFTPIMGANLSGTTNGVFVTFNVTGVPTNITAITGTNAYFSNGVFYVGTSGSLTGALTGVTPGPGLTGGTTNGTAYIQTNGVDGVNIASLSNALYGVVIPTINTNSNSAAATAASLITTIINALTQSNTLNNVAIPNIASNVTAQAATASSLTTTIANANTTSNTLQLSLTNSYAQSNTLNNVAIPNIASNVTAQAGTATSLTTTIANANTQSNTLNNVAIPNIASNVTAQAATASSLTTTIANANTASNTLQLSLTNSYAQSNTLNNVVIPNINTNSNSAAATAASLITTIINALTQSNTLNNVAIPNIASNVTAQAATASSLTATIANANTTSNTLQLSLTNSYAASNTLNNVVIPNLSSNITSTAANSSSISALSMLQTTLSNLLNNTVSSVGVAFTDITNIYGYITTVSNSDQLKVPLTATVQTIGYGTSMTFTNAAGDTWQYLSSGGVIAKNRSGNTWFTYIPSDTNGQANVALTIPGSGGFTANENGLTFADSHGNQAIASNGVWNFFGTDLRASNQTLFSPVSVLTPTNADLRYSSISSVNSASNAAVAAQTTANAATTITQLNNASNVLATAAQAGSAALTNLAAGNASAILGTTSTTALAGNTAVQAPSAALTNVSSGGSNNYFGAFTGNHTVGQEAFEGFTNSSLGNGQNPDLNIGGNAQVIISGFTAAINIPGIAGGSSNRAVTIISEQNVPVTFNNESSGDGVATNRLRIAGGDLTLTGTPIIAHFIYSATDQRWLYNGTAGSTGYVLTQAGFSTNQTLVTPTIQPANSAAVTVQFPATSNPSADQVFSISGSPWTSGAGFGFHMKMTNVTTLAGQGPDVNGYYDWDSQALTVNANGLQSIYGNMPGVNLLVANGEPIVLADSSGTGNKGLLWAVEDTNLNFSVLFPYTGNNTTTNNRPLTIVYNVINGGVTNQVVFPQDENNTMKVDEHTGSVILYNPGGSGSLTLGNGQLLTTTNGIFTKANGTLANGAFDATDANAVNLSDAVITATNYVANHHAVFTSGSIAFDAGGNGSGMTYEGSSGFYGLCFGIAGTPQMNMITGSQSYTGFPSVGVGGSEVETQANISRGTFSIDGSLATAIATYTSSTTNVFTNSTVLLNGMTNIVVLPDATFHAIGRIYTIKEIANSTGQIWVGVAGQHIDAGTNYSLSAQYKYVTVQSDGTQWWIIGNN